MDKGNFKITLVVIIMLLTLSQLALAAPLVSSAVIPVAEVSSPPLVTSNIPPPGSPSVESPPLSPSQVAVVAPTAVEVIAPVPEAPTSLPPGVPESTPAVVTANSQVLASPPPVIPEGVPAVVSATSSGPTTPPPGIPVGVPAVVSATSSGPTTPPPGVPDTSPSVVSAEAVPPPLGVGPPPAEAAQFQSWLQTNEQPVRPPQQVTVIKPILPPIIHNVPPPPLRKRMVTSITIRQGCNAPLVSSPPISYKRSQEIMLRSAPSSPPPSPDAVAAFNGMLAQHMPLTPKQVVQLRQLIDKSQRAASIPATIPPKPVSSTLIINLSPGATPPAIRIAQGYVSSLVFVDSGGSPWPIAGFEVGDPKTTTIQWDGKSNIIFMQAISPYSQGNLVIRLVGLLTPITLEIVSGQRVVDYRTDIHVPGIGPNSKDFSIGTSLPLSANQFLLSVLDGVAPPGSRELVVKGGEGQVWLVGDTMYLRTRLTLLSPGWVGKMTSPDGMFAYELQRTSSVLVSQYGNPVELKVEGY